MENQYMPRAEKLPEVAYYYPNQYWHDVDWIKNLILFFDGIANLIPEYMHDHFSTDDLAVVEGLKEHGLFHVLRPEQIVDSETAGELTSILYDLIEGGVFDELMKEHGSDFHTLSGSRMGFYGDPELAKIVLEQLKARGLARDTEDGKSIPMHWIVRSSILVLLAQLLKKKGHQLGFDLSPITDQPRVVGALEHLLTRSSMPTAGHVVAFDLQELGVDLGSVPIDEVLSFRRENYDDYRAYLLHLRQFVRALSEMPEAERQMAFEQREAELKSLGEDLKKKATKAWKKPFSFGLGLIGTGIGILATSNPLGAAGGLTRVAGALAGGIGSDNSTRLGAFSYLFKARRSFQ